MKIVSRGIVYASQGSSGRGSCSFPTVCVSQSGRWLCGFRAAPSKSNLQGQQVLIAWSDDQGHSWSDPIAPFLPLKVEGVLGTFRCVGLTSLRDGTLVAVICWVDDSDPSLAYYNPETEGLLDTHIFISRSQDDGATWLTPSRMDTSPFKVPVPITGPILELNSGELACQFEVNKPYRDPSVWRHSSVLLFSKDEGRTWPEHVVTSNDPDNRFFYWDQRPGVLGDGQLLDVFWTYDNQQATYLNIHARVSSDQGRSWSQMWDTGVPGQPAAPVALSQGRIGLVYVDRTTAPAIKMRVSHDDGRSWPQANELVLYAAEIPAQSTEKAGMNDAWAEMAKFSVGLPATTLIKDGDVIAVYYAGPGFDETSIHWVRVKA